MKKIIFLGVLSIMISLCFLPNAKAINKEDYLYKKQVTYDYIKVYEKEEDALKAKTIEETKLLKLQEEIKNTEGKFTYQVEVEKILKDKTVKEINFTSYEDYLTNIESIEKNENNALYIIPITKTFDNEQDAIKYKNDLEQKGFSVSVTITPKYKTETKTLTNTYETKKEAETACNNFVKDGKNTNCSYQNIIDNNDKQETTNDYYFKTRKEAENKKIELLKEDNSIDQIVTATISDNPVETLSEKEKIEKTFATKEEAEKYITNLQNDGYVITDKQITEVKTSEEVIIPGSTTGTIGTGQANTTTWSHLDILVNNTVTLIDKNNNTKNVNGTITLSSVKANNNSITMGKASIDPNRHDYEFASINRNLTLTNNTFVEITGTIKYKDNNVDKTSNFKINGYLNETNNECKGKGRNKGFDLKFQSITISEDRVVIDSNVKAYKLTANKQTKQNMYKLTTKKTIYDIDVKLNASKNITTLENYLLNGTLKRTYQVFQYVLQSKGIGYKLYGDVIVRYVDIDTNNEIVKQDHTYGQVNNSYNTNPKDLTNIDFKYIDKYKINKTNLKTNGKYINDQIIITYYYKKDNPKQVPSINTGINKNDNKYLISFISASTLLGITLLLKKKFN